MLCPAAAEQLVAVPAMVMLAAAVYSCHGFEFGPNLTWNSGAAYVDNLARLLTSVHKAAAAACSLRS